MYTYNQLITTQSEAEAVAELKQVLTGSGFNVITDAKPGTVAYSLLMLASKIYVAGQNQAATLATNSVEKTAEADFLTAISDSFFNNQRFGATQTVGNVFLSYAAGRPSKTFSPGGLQVNFTAPNTVQYGFTNVNQISLVPPSSGPPATGTFSFRAITPGSGPSTVLFASTGSVQTVPGLTVTIPYNGALLLGWQSSLGLDAEVDPSLHIRNETKWSTLAAVETPTSRVTNAIVSQSLGALYDVYVDASNPRGPGTLDVYCSSATAVATQFQIDQISGSIQQLFFNGAGTLGGTSPRVLLKPATAVVFGAAGSGNETVTIYYDKTYTLATVTQNVEAALTTWLGGIPTGGKTYASGVANIADIDDFIATLYSVAGVVKVKITSTPGVSPGQDIDLGPPGFKKLVAPTLWSSVITYVQSTR